MSSGALTFSGIVVCRQLTQGNQKEPSSSVNGSAGLSEVFAHAMTHLPGDLPALEEGRFLSPCCWLQHQILTTHQ